MLCTIQEHMTIILKGNINMQDIIVVKKKNCSIFTFTFLLLNAGMHLKER